MEYKQGKRQKKAHDDVQLVAQALCLEEMTGQAVPEGAVFHHKSRRRRVVAITPDLRELTLGIAAQVRAMLASGVLPPPTTDRALCRECSLADSCQPDLVGNALRIRRLQATLFEVDDE